MLLLITAVACGSGDISVRQRFLAQSSVSVKFNAWVRALNNQNRDSVALFYHHSPELRVLAIDGTISHGWEEESEVQREFFETVELVNFVPGEPEIDVLAKDMVLTTFRHTLDIERANRQRDPTVRGLGSILWTRDPDDDTWKIRLLQLSARPRSGELEP
jgi:hypothetical protein